MDIVIYYIFFILIYVLIIGSWTDKLLLKKILSNSDKTLYMFTKNVNQNLRSTSKVFKFLSYNKWLTFSIVYSILLVYMFIGMPINIVKMLFKCGLSIKLFRYNFISFCTNSIYNMFSYIDEISLFDYDNYVNREFWYNFFNKYNHKSPYVFGKLENNHFIGKVPSKKINLVWEPIKSCSTKYINFKELKDSPKKGSYLLRERVSNNILVKLTTYKIKEDYTLIAKKIIFLKKNKQLTYEIVNYCCYKNGKYSKDLPKYISKKINLAIDDCISLHKDLNYKGVVEWHLNFDENSYYFVSANINPIICNHSSSDFYNCFEEYINMIKN